MFTKENTGVIAFGVKTGIITFDDKISDVVVNTFKKNPDLLQNKDIVCIGEAVTAISQHNTVYLNDVKVEIKKKLNLKDNKVVGVLFPILN
jgi:F420-0:gamma-glutamyl ligase